MWTHFRAGVRRGFHVDKLSSAHVYLRMPKGQTMEMISPELLEDCAQLVKANSIQENKLNNLNVVYTPWYNLRKTQSMDVGQVGFHNSKFVRTVRVETPKNEIVNRLNKTNTEETPDLKDAVVSVSLIYLQCFVLLANTFCTNQSASF
uniref:NFACT RNA-binding domain-containing protein n=2 Tax=Physcomitrium patens TaxID=3218 RepID=A0A2K1K2G4_PHYPA|nr:hypothetical protein PHYPA_012441 [Physcomitrium patens]